MSWKKVFGGLPIPGLSTAIATIKGTKEVIDIAMAATGKSTPEEAEEVFSGDPELLLQFRLDVAEIALKKQEATIADVQHARSSNMKSYLKDGVGIVSALAFVVMLFVVAYSALWGTSLQDTPLVMLVFGAVITGWNQLQSFYFGSADSNG